MNHIFSCIHIKTCTVACLLAQLFVFCFNCFLEFPPQRICQWRRDCVSNLLVLMLDVTRKLIPIRETLQHIIKNNICIYKLCWKGVHNLVKNRPNQALVLVFLNFRLVSYKISKPWQTVQFAVYIENQTVP